MSAAEEFSPYMTEDRPVGESTYMKNRLFPLLDELRKKKKRFALAQIWLTVGECTASLSLPILALFPFSIPSKVLGLILASLGILISAALFAQQLLCLSKHAAEYAAKEKTILRLTRAYFICSSEFALTEDPEARLKLLCDRIEGEMS